MGRKVISTSYSSAILKVPLRRSDLRQILNLKLINFSKFHFYLGCRKPQEYIAPVVTMRKIWNIYKIITFLKSIRELTSQGNQRSGIQKSDKIILGETRYTDCSPFGKTQGEEVAAIEESWKKQAKILPNS